MKTGGRLKNAEFVELWTRYVSYGFSTLILGQIAGVVVEACACLVADESKKHFDRNSIRLRLMPNEQLLEADPELGELSRRHGAHGRNGAVAALPTSGPPGPPPGA